MTPHEFWDPSMWTVIKNLGLHFILFTSENAWNHQLQLAPTQQIWGQNLLIKITLATWVVLHQKAHDPITCFLTWKECLWKMIGRNFHICCIWHTKMGWSPFSSGERTRENWEFILRISFLLHQQKQHYWSVWNIPEAYWIFKITDKCDNLLRL